MEEVNVSLQIKKWWDQLHSVRMINNDVSHNDFLTVNEEIFVAEYPRDDYTLNSITNTKYDVEDKGEDREAEEIKFYKPSKKEIYEHLKWFIEKIPNDIL